MIGKNQRIKDRRKSAKGVVSVIRLTSPHGVVRITHLETGRWMELEIGRTVQEQRKKYFISLNKILII